MTNSKEEIKNIFLEEENKLKMDKNKKVNNDTKNKYILNCYKYI